MLGRFDQPVEGLSDVSVLRSRYLLRLPEGAIKNFFFSPVHGAFSWIWRVRKWAWLLLSIRYTMHVVKVSVMSRDLSGKLTWLHCPKDRSSRQNRISSSNFNKDNIRDAKPNPAVGQIDNFSWTLTVKKQRGAGHPKICLIPATVRLDIGAASNERETCLPYGAFMSLTAQEDSSKIRPLSDALV